MTYSLDDFGNGDLNQYFSDAWVQYTANGGVKAGYIAGFSGDKAILRSQTDEDVVSLSQISWSGLTKPRCVAYDGQIWFVGPSGYRSYKKPPTGSNTMALTYRSDEVPYLVGPGTGNGSVSSNLLQRYLVGDSAYHLDRDGVNALMEHNATSIALTPTTGMFRNGSGRWVFVDNCVIKERTSRYNESLEIAVRYINND